MRGKGSAEWFYPPAFSVGHVEHDWITALWENTTVMLAKAFVIWCIIAAAEVGQGILRVRFLNRRVGDHRARQIGVFTGSVIILVIAWLAAPWINCASTGQQLGVGLSWLALMLAFEIGFGRWVFRASWKRIFADFDVRKGNLLAFGMLVILLAPIIVAKLRGLL